jgi:hypothetical protein
MRLGLVKIFVALAVVWLLWSGVSGFANPVWQSVNECVCPGCVKQAREHKNRDLIFAPIDPWQTVDNKVVYY